jgi:hypothetical protein
MAQRTDLRGKRECTLILLDEMRIDGRDVSFRYVFQLAGKRGLDDPIAGRLRVVVLAEVEDA